MVTPELVEPLDANQVPPCGPGMETASPSDWELFFKGHMEVPVCCNGGAATGQCGGGCPTPAPAGVFGPQPSEPLPTPAPAASTAPPPTPTVAIPAPIRKTRTIRTRRPRPTPTTADPPFGGPIGYDPLN